MVQVLKEEIRSAILRAAQDEFIEYGYLSASLRRIASKVGVSVGNLYRYYAGKEELFDAIVAPAYVELERILLHHESHATENAPIVELIIETFSKIDKELRKSLFILIDSSRATRHEQTVQALYKMMAENIVRHLEKNNLKTGTEEFTQEVAWPISIAFMQGFFAIIRRNTGTEDYQKVLRQYVTFWYRGLQSFI